MRSPDPAKFLGDQAVKLAGSVDQLSAHQQRLQRLMADPLLTGPTRPAAGDGSAVTRRVDATAAARALALGATALAFAEAALTAGQAAQTLLTDTEPDSVTWKTRRELRYYSRRLSKLAKVSENATRDAVEAADAVVTQRRGESGAGRRRHAKA